MIGLIVISNRPADLEKFISSMSVLGPFRQRFQVFALLQPPFNGREQMLRKIDHYQMVNAYDPPIPFVYFRYKAMRLAEAYGAEWFWSLDDDHRFQDSKGDTFNKTCAQYYAEVFEYLKNNNHIGVLSCRGFFGGYASGYNFVENPKNGLVATDKGGMFFRNIGVDNIIGEDEIGLRGSLFESLATYNIMSYNFRLARRYNSPISNRPPGKEKKQGVTNNISYCDETINANIQGHIRKKYDDENWTHSSKHYPKYIEEKVKLWRSE